MESLPTISSDIVLLPAHTDHELGVVTRHYHADPRFTDDKRVIIDRGQEVKWVKKKIINANAVGNSGVSMYLMLLNGQAGKKLNCGRCPHKGLPLNADGVCMGHGLRFDKAGNVLGNLKECYLRVKETGDCGGIGQLMGMRIGISGYVETMQLWIADNMLAESRIGPVDVAIGDYLKMSWSLQDRRILIDGGQVVLLPFGS